jgi:hypothetical protein
MLSTIISTVLSDGTIGLKKMYWQTSAIVDKNIIKKQKEK